ncbi:MAG: hypothetical protein ACUVTF_07065 [bacterium]
MSVLWQTRLPCRCWPGWYYGWGGHFIYAELEAFCKTYPNETVQGFASKRKIHLRMILLLILTIFLVIVSFTVNRAKTLLGIKRGLKMFLGILPMVLNVLILVSIFLYLVP